MHQAAITHGSEENYTCGLEWLIFSWIVFSEKVLSLHIQEGSKFLLFLSPVYALSQIVYFNHLQRVLFIVVCKLYSFYVQIEKSEFKLHLLNLYFDGRSYWDKGVKSDEIKKCWMTVGLFTFFLIWVTITL